MTTESDLRVLTICQPWAWGIIHGPKRIENRPWRMNYRGPLVIHAGKSRDWLHEGRPLLPGLPPDNQLPFGALLGMVDVVGCVEWKPGAILNLPIGTPDCQEDFSAGPFCIILANPRAFERPIPMGGKLGLWRLSVADFETAQRAAERSVFDRDQNSAAIEQQDTGLLPGQKALAFD